MNAKNDILKKLAKKTGEYKKYREQSISVNPSLLVKEFIDAIELAHVRSPSGDLFAQDVEIAKMTLTNKLSRFDRNVCVQIIWNKEDQAEVWQDLHPTGVRILWSNFWQKENPSSDGEMYISVEQLWLEGL